MFPSDKIKMANLAASRIEVLDPSEPSDIMEAHNWCIKLYEIMEYAERVWNTPMVDWCVEQMQKYEAKFMTED